MTIGWSRVNEHIIEFYLYCIRYTINILYYLADLQQVRLKSEFLKIGNFGENSAFFKKSDLLKFLKHQFASKSGFSINTKMFNSHAPACQKVQKNLTAETFC